MRKLVLFNHLTLDGYFTGASGDLSWAHTSERDAEWDSFAANNAKGGGILLFGRVTYELMASYWPSADARKSNPIVAERMNHLPKVVFSRTLETASWNNTKLVKGNLAEEERKLKDEPGGDMAILGSGSIASQLAREGLIDEYQLVVNPVILGKGKTMFEGVQQQLTLKLASTRAFGNGNVLLCYEPAA
jgi:dihydrofolate reductase